MFETIGVFFQKIGIVIGSVFLAIGGSLGAAPVTDNVQQNQIVEQTEIQETSTTTDKKSENNSNDKQEPIKEVAEPTSIVTKTYQAPVGYTPEVVDVCSNIEGDQTSVPSGYTSNGSVCTLVVLDDLCPNIAGTQNPIPNGYSLYRNTNECLTDREITNYEEERAALKQKESQCNSATDERLALNEEIVSVKEEYATKINDTYNAGGGLASGQYYTITKIESERDAKISALYDQISIAVAKIDAYCN